MTILVLAPNFDQQKLQSTLSALRTGNNNVYAYSDPVSQSMIERCNSILVLDNISGWYRQPMIINILNYAKAVSKPIAFLSDK
jgi:hypothetical protein